MKLETSLELLERMRVALGGVSYYRIAKVLQVRGSAVARWKAGKGGMARELAPRIAELLAESPEYILACLEHDREPSADVRRIWKRIAEAFRSKAAAIALTLIGGWGLLSAGNPVSALQISPADPAGQVDRDMHYTKRRRRLRWRWWRNLRDPWLTWLPMHTPA